VVLSCELVVSADIVLAQLVARDASADILISDLAAEHGGASAALCRFHRLAPNHRALDEFEHVLVGLAFIVVRVHVDDQEILVIALARLLGGVLQVLAGRVVVAGKLAHFAAEHIHGRALLKIRP
jgi:hypothetical protein